MFRKIIIILFLVYSCLSSYGQVFNRNYIYSISDIQTARSINKIANDTFLVIAANRNLANINLGIGTFLIDNNGDTLLTNSFIDTTKSQYVGWANSTNPTLDGGYIMGG